MKEFMSEQRNGLHKPNAFEDEARAWAKNITLGMQGPLAAAYLAGASEGNVQLRHALAKAQEEQEELRRQLTEQQGAYKSLKANADTCQRRLEEAMVYRQEVLRLEALTEALNEKLARREARKGKVKAS